MSWGLLAEVPRETLGDGGRSLMSELEGVVGGLPDNAQSSDIHAAVRTALRGGLLAAVSLDRSSAPPA